MEILIKKLSDISSKKDFIKLSKDASKRYITNNYDFYGAYEGDNLVGGIVIDSSPDHFHYRGLGLFPEIIVEFFFVSKKYRKQGIGKDLFNIALRHKSIGLRTGGMTTDIAKDFYAKLGFKVVKTRRFGKTLTEYWYYEKDV